MPTTGAPGAVRPEIYGVMPVSQVESLLRRETMPAPFIRRMRVINLLSALTLRKIDDNMIAPFSVMDIHHILDEQISQDAIIAMLENKNLALALETGELQPLWAESKEETLLRRGFNQKWIQRFITTPFDPVCVMLAMRAKLMLDVVDELGHSYNLLRALGMGWLDFGEIPGEDPGNPDDYIPPIIDQPIDDPSPPPDPVPGDPDYVPGPGEPGYIPPEDLVPGDPGYVPGPGDPGYIPPGDVVPGEPGYVPEPDSPDYIPPPDRIPGDPGYEGVPGEAPGYPEGWDEAIHPGHPDYDPGPGDRGYYAGPSPGGGLYGGDFGPGGEGTPGGPYGGGGDFASLLPPLPLGYGPGWMLSGRGFGIGGFGGGIDCCLDKDNPLLNVTIGYYTSGIDAGETLGLTVEQAHEDCDGGNYEWIEVNGVGSLDAETGKSVIYTAPATGHNCPGNAEIWLSCGGEVIDTLAVTINYDYAIKFNYGDPELEIDREDSLVVSVTANNTPLTWAVSGTGFSLEHEETDGTGNVLHADETACGSATITATGCDEVSATGYVRCTTGQWTALQAGCVLSGLPDTYNYVLNQLIMEKTLGKYFQTERLMHSFGVEVGGCDATDCSEHCTDGSCIGCDACLSIEGFCAHTDTPVQCSPWCCAFGSCDDIGYCFCVKSQQYKEWTC